MKKTTERIWDKPGTDKFLESTIQYFYENPGHVQLTRKEQSGNGRTLITEYTYPADYTTISTGPISAMKSDRHMHGVVIEQTVKERKQGSIYVLGSNFTDYGFVGQDDPATSSKDERFVLPMAIKQTELKAPTTDFVSSIPTGTAADNSYTPRLSMQYHTTSARILQMQRTDDMPIAYLWGYHHTYLLAEVTNATYQQVVDALGQATLDALNSNPGTDEQIREKLKVLNTHPAFKQSNVKIYTYDPLVGITSETDNNNDVKYYQYDNVGRLKSVKDDEGNILSVFEYHYKNQN